MQPKLYEYYLEVKADENENKNAVIYTHVSNKEQADKNLSLSTQKELLKMQLKEIGVKFLLNLVVLMKWLKQMVVKNLTDAGLY